MFGFSEHAVFTIPYQPGHEEGQTYTYTERQT
jgi:hypothetical protein